MSLLLGLSGLLLIDLVLVSSEPEGRSSCDSFQVPQQGPGK
jgi:hypothetical protein